MAQNAALRSLSPQHFIMVAVYFTSWVKDSNEKGCNVCFITQSVFVFFLFNNI
jgi:hypothetical protein